MRICVDDQLPQYFFTLIGKYAQTYAYIEQTIWFIICLSKDTNWEDEVNVSSMLLIRRNTDKLRSEARDCCKILPDNISNAFKDCLDAFDDASLQRNIAIHGAWERGSSEQDFRVDYMLNNGTNKNPDWQMFFKTDFNISEIILSIKTLNDLLIEVSKVRKSVSALKSASPTS